MAEVAAGAFLSSLFQFLFERMDSLEIVHFFKGQKLHHGLLKKLKVTMITVNGLLVQAEEKQIIMPAVKEWLNELKGAVYEADDLLDDIAYEAPRSKLEVGSSRQKVFSSHHHHHHNHTKIQQEVNAKLEEILGLLERLVKQTDALGLSMRKGIGEKPSSLKIPTISTPDDEYGIYGRDDDKKAILHSLQSDDVGVICIVGIGGLAWVCVSEEFDVSRIMKDILKEVTGENYDAKNELCSELKEKLEGKKLLLVMDDVWNDKPSDWAILRACLQTQAAGSKISFHHLNNLSDDACWYLFAKHAFGDGNSSAHSDLNIIGRQIAKKCRGVLLAAKTIGTVLRFKRDVVEWEKVLGSDMWDLVSDSILPALKLSYHYLPSHIKWYFAYCTIFPKDFEFYEKQLIDLWMAEGFLLHSTGIDEEMEYVGNEYFKDLSCFVMHDLIHDLARFISGEFCSELEGNRFPKLPLSTRHLSHSVTHFGSYDELGRINEGLLLHTFLYMKLSNHFDTKVTYDSLSLLEHLRVLSLPGYCSATQLPDSFGNLNHLRYLNLYGASIRRLPEALSTLYHLQTLILFQCQNLVKLPNNVGRLIDLRCLDIRETKLRKMPPQIGGSSIKELRELHYIGGEVTLQTLQNVVNVQDACEANLSFKYRLKKLEFKWSGEVKDSKHVNGILEQLKPGWNLESLCIVGYGGTKFPSWMVDSVFSKLMSLKLDECKNCSCLPMLGQLPSLQDLSIAAFDQVTSIGPEFYGSFMGKPFGSLKALRFERMPLWNCWTDENEAFPLLRDLHMIECSNLTKGLPSHLPSLTALLIKGCQKLVESLPRAPWCLLNLTSGPCHLQVDRFDSLNFLEKMKDLYTVLEDIKISNDNSLRCFPLTSFSELKRVQIWGCPNLESFSAAEAFGNPISNTYLTGPCSNFPPIQQFHIRDFDKLDLLVEIHKEHLHGVFNTFEEITVTGCNVFKYFLLVSFPMLKSLVIKECPKLESFSPPDEATSGDFESCVSLERWKHMHTDSMPGSCSNFPNLENICIINCQQLPLLSVPWAPTIQKLALLNESRDSQVGKFRSPEEIEMWLMSSGSANVAEMTIEDCDSLSYNPLVLFPKLESLNIRRCSNIKSFSLSEAMQQEITSLSLLATNECPNLASFPEGLQAPYLTELYLWDCINLQSLDDYIHTFFPILVVLKIGKCPEFESFPKGGLPTKLQSLEIQSCSKLYSLPSLLARNYIEDDDEFFPEETLLPTTLTHLTIRDLQNLKSPEIRNRPILHSKPECMQSLHPSLVKLKIYDCPGLEPFIDASLLEKLESLDVGYSNELVAGLIRCDLHILPSLTRFRVAGYDDLESFPEETVLPSGLTHLQIQGLQKPKSLQLQHLTSLRKLEIRDYPELQYLPGKRLSSSLSSLSISRCPLLRTGCMRQDSGVWAKICHFPSIWIDYVQYV
ncbi:hypothetical protein P3X46_010857 [Hevea brasiliensis]|uniref:Rx N-terminal domain-containing protein n=1 Tax=Hevea brasiliensis TaxID=3981 RepID=A0ABQ9MGI7_HEVBR|nr:hypothetical protein P3X46_010857 [Hevea brasiliensis]